MKKNKTIKYPGVGVDAGMICVADGGWLKRQGGAEGGDTDVEKGQYDVELTVHNCWHGRVTVKKRLWLDGPVYIGDPGYGPWPLDTWHKLLERTGYMRKLPMYAARRILVADTGGDGSFRVTVKLRRIEA